MTFLAARTGHVTAVFFLIPLTIGALGYGYLGLVTGAIESLRVSAPMFLCVAGWVGVAAKRPKVALAAAFVGLTVLAWSAVLEWQAVGDLPD